MTHEYLKLLVVEHKIVDYQYFMDDMEIYEVFSLLELIPWANKISYDQMRYNVWASLKPYLKNQDITPERLIPLYTDHAHENVPDVPKNDIEKFEAIKKQILEKYQTQS